MLRRLKNLVTDFACLCLFGFRLTIVDGTREKRDCLSSLLEQKHISLFYCSSHKAILNPHQHGRETQFLTKSFGSLFFRKGTVLGWATRAFSGRAQQLEFQALRGQHRTRLGFRHQELHSLLSPLSRPERCTAAHRTRA